MAGVTIGAANLPTLTAQPYGYEGDPREGLTARSWAISGLVKPSEWLALIAAYENWRNLRIQDEDTLASGVVGTTINLSGKGPGGQVWTAIPCWFTEPPQADQAGALLSVSVTLVDANQALEVLLRSQEKLEEGLDLPDFGTITLGSAVLKLTKQPDAYAANPTLEFTATGNHYITGTLKPFLAKEIEGTTDASGWNAVRAWYENIISSSPSAGTLFPLTSPSATAENRIVQGVKQTVYIVNVQLGQVI